MGTYLLVGLATGLLTVCYLPNVFAEDDSFDPGIAMRGICFVGLSLLWPVTWLVMIRLFVWSLMPPKEDDAPEIWIDFSSQHFGDLQRPGPPFC